LLINPIMRAIKVNLGAHFIVFFGFRLSVLGFTKLAVEYLCGERQLFGQLC
jgi:hypothetical protein